MKPKAEDKEAMLPKVVVLRWGHRHRDQRLTSHVALAARALGASGFIMADITDDKVKETVEKTIHTKLCLSIFSGMMRDYHLSHLIPLPMNQSRKVTVSFPIYLNTFCSLGSICFKAAIKIMNFQT